MTFDHTNVPPDSVPPVVKEPWLTQSRRTFDRATDPARLRPKKLDTR